MPGNVLLLHIRDDMHACIQAKCVLRHRSLGTLARDIWSQWQLADLVGRVYVACMLLF